MTVQHGTLNAYSKRKCRCDECRGASARYNQDLRARRSQTGEPPQHVHGTAGGYINWMCRCPECTEAQRVNLAAFRQRKREGVAS